MKLSFLAGTALLALAVSEPAVSDQRFTFTYTGSIVSFTVPVTGTYQIIAFGAQGGNSATFINQSLGPTFGAGGQGAEIGGQFSLTAGDVLQIAVGGAGANGTGPSSAFGGGGGGGGGSFVVGPGNTPLVIAGGGGGGGLVVFQQGLGCSDCGSPGEGGRTDQNGNGNGGAASNIPFLAPPATAGGGGGGFLGAGMSAVVFQTQIPLGGGGGGGFPDLTGGLGFGSVGAGDLGGNGGFGGGGGGSIAGCGGGGGGYSGGAGAGTDNQHGCGPGGGGGSLNAGTNQILVAGIQIGNGEVMISPAFAGTPGEANCHGESVSALTQQFGGLDGAAAGLGFSDVSALQNAITQFCGG